MSCRRCLCLVLFVAALTPIARADDAQSRDAPSAQGEQLVALMDNLGDHEMKITTSSPLAQKYFNQGLLLMYGFNHAEAIRAFRAAATLDPKCAMAYWGIALALGPNYNAPMDAQPGIEAYAALQKAESLAPEVAPKQQAYIEALSHRYDYPPPEDRTSLDEAYADAMGKLAQRYPDDFDAATLYAEAMMDLRPWGLWTEDGKPEPGTAEILKTLEGVLASAPNHPGANHYYIHAVEPAQPEKGIPSAERLGGLAPGAGHLVHMPAHIFFRVGRYHDASKANRAAAESDEAYIARYKPEGIYPLMYYPHNIHFLWASAAMEGKSEQAIAAATKVGNVIPEQMAKQMPMLEVFTPTRLFALTRFRKWNEILDEPAPDPELSYTTGMWHYARGMAYAAKGELSQAEEEFRQLHQITLATPEEQRVMQQPAVDLLQIGVDHLQATLMARTRQLDAAEEKLRDAVARQDALRYAEPPPWYLPMRQPLGALLLETNRPAEAEKTYREDLEKYPENGWALHGLEQSLRAQDRNDEADRIHRRFEKAWPNADTRPY